MTLNECRMIDAQRDEKLALEEASHAVRQIRSWKHAYAVARGCRIQASLRARAAELTVAKEKEKL